MEAGATTKVEIERGESNMKSLRRIVAMEEASESVPHEDMRQCLSKRVNRGYSVTLI